MIIDDMTSGRPPEWSVHLTAPAARSRGRVGTPHRLLAFLVGILAATAGCDSAGPTGPIPPNGVQPQLVATVAIPPNYGIHDMFVRDGVVFVSAWNTGVIIYDIGGVGSGTPANPIELTRFVPTGGAISGRIHNAWWFHNPNTGEKRYLFLGQEGPGVIGSQSSGDIFVLDVTDLSAPVQVGRYTLAGAGTHNFWMDEEAEILYAAYYNAGIVALDVSGTLPEDLTGREIARALPAAASYVWGVQEHRGSLYASDMLNGFIQLRLQGNVLEVMSGVGNVAERFTSDLWLHGDHAYTGTWGQRGAVHGNALKIWNLSSGGAPVLADSVIFTDVGIVSDVEVSSDGRILVASAEVGAGAGIYLFALDDPLAPRLLWREQIPAGIHTTTIEQMNGRTYVFAARNPDAPAMLIFDVTDLMP